MTLNADETAVAAAAAAGAQDAGNGSRDSRCDTSRAPGIFFIFIIITFFYPFLL
jgi:hypothetical protein